MNTLEQHLKNIEKIVEYLGAIESASIKETQEMFLGKITVGDFQHTIQLGLDKGSFAMNDKVQLTLPERGTGSMDLSNKKEFKYALHSGNNVAGENAEYYCHHCDLDIHGTDVGFVAAGTRYANCEMSRCPRCGEENSVEWDEDYDG